MTPSGLLTGAGSVAVFDIVRQFEFGQPNNEPSQTMVYYCMGIPLFGMMYPQMVCEWDGLLLGQHHIAGYNGWDYEIRCD